MYKKFTPPYPNPQFRLEFLLPKFWLTWCWLGLLRMTLYLPRKWVMWLGGWMGDQLRKRNQKRRHIVEVNLSLCFPEWSEQKRQQLLVDHFRQHVRGLLDMALVFWASPARFAKVCTFPQRDSLSALAQNNPVILVGYHLTTMDIAGTALAGFNPLVAIMKKIQNPLVNWQLWKGRTRLDKTNYHILMRDGGLRPLLRAMKNGHAGLLVPDEDYRKKSKTTVFAPFFGVQSSTLTIVSNVAKLTGAKVVLIAAQFNAKTSQYTVKISKPMQNFPSDDEQVDATALNQEMEKLIEPVMEQYMWTFRWFTTRPNGEPNPYK